MAPRSPSCRVRYLP
uniref:Uncharacterized protein n=1 Tax=Arundo donax TaxID=35708 RepID=A0A0A8Z4L3_ARUDO